MKNVDVVAICNALVDIMVQVEDADIQRLSLTKGIMHLVDAERQDYVLSHFLDRPHTIELGGSGLNALRTIAGLGGKTAFSGMIGFDKFGRKIQNRLAELKIQGQLVEGDYSTGSCAVLVSPDGERTMNTHLGASRLFDEKLVPQQHIVDAKVLHVTGYQWDTEGQKRAMYQAIELAKESRCLLSFDVADPFVIDRHRDEILLLIEKHADIVFSNAEEAKMLYGRDVDFAAQQIAQSGAIAVIKLGGEGCLVRKNGESFRLPAEKVNVVDTTAAGDVFAGGFLYGYTQGKDLKTCAQSATLCAADVIQRLTTTVSDATLKSVAQL